MVGFALRKDVNDTIEIDLRMQLGSVNVGEAEVVRMAYVL